MTTLSTFSEKERHYFQYQARQEYLREQRTIQLELEQAERALSNERLEKEAAMQEMMAAQVREEAAMQEKEAAMQEKEAAQSREKAALAEIERLKSLIGSEK